MGIFRRMKTIVLAEVNEQIDRWEDPVAMTKQYLRELEEQLERGRQALAQQWVAERRYETLIAQAEATIEKRSRQAKLALERNEEAVAKIALRDKPERCPMPWSCPIDKQNRFLCFSIVLKLIRETKEYRR